MEGTHKIGFVLKAALLLVFLGLVTRTEASLVISDGCGNVTTELSACADLIGINVQINSPSNDCCLGLQAIVDAAVELGDTRTCRCIRRSPRLLLVSPGVLLRLNAQILNLAYGQCRFILGVNGTATANLPLDCLSSLI